MVNHLPRRNAAGRLPTQADTSELLTLLLIWRCSIIVYLWKATVRGETLSLKATSFIERPSAKSWLYVVFNCALKPQVTTIQNPARFNWEPLSKIDCYRLGSETILKCQLGQPVNTSGGRQARTQD